MSTSAAGGQRSSRRPAIGGVAGCRAPPVARAAIGAGGCHDLPRISPHLEL